ncbi:MAG: STAS domain-containing protein [Spirochaetales bacterium]|nr:STAS domain-containing protein [Spirochaetales bacterium]
MELNYEKVEDTIHIQVTGDIDFEGDYILNEKFEEILNIDGVKSIIINLSEVEKSISSGIGHLVKFHKQLSSRSRTLEIKGISENLFKLFKDINLEKLFPITK